MCSTPTTHTAPHSGQLTRLSGAESTTRATLCRVRTAHRQCRARHAELQNTASLRARTGNASPQPGHNRRANFPTTPPTVRPAPAGSPD
ncbi:hypothetical protein GCM10009678_54120 [Actinomadura kijaniata]